MACYWNEVDIVRWMATNPDVNGTPSTRLTVTPCIMSLFGGTEIAQILVHEGGANVNAVDKYGMTPVHKVCRNNCIGIAKILRIRAKLT